jgi:hypothetical protein
MFYIASMLSSNMTIYAFCEASYINQYLEYYKSAHCPRNGTMPIPPLLPTHIADAFFVSKLQPAKFYFEQTQLIS